MPDITSLTEWLHQHQSWVAISIFLIAFVESLAIAGIIVPGVALLFAVATIAGNGALSLPLALFCAFLGAVAGDGLSYYIGAHFKQSIYQVWPLSRYPGLIESGETFFNRHGGKSVLIARFIGPIRPILPMIAGSLAMPPKRFLAFNTLSAIGWAPLYVLPGYLVGASLQSEVTLPPHFYPILVGALSGLGVFAYLFSRLHWSLRSEGRIYQRLQKWVQRYNIGHQFWRGLASNRSTGGEFPLTSISVAGVSLALFALLSLTVLYTPWLTQANQLTHHFFSQLRNPFTDPLFIIFTLLGDQTFAYIIFTTFVLTLFANNHKMASLHVAAAGIATAFLTHGIKHFYGIPRPNADINPFTSFAFPSGHTSASTVFWFLLASFIAQELKKESRWKVYMVCFIPVICTALSRLYLGVHWLSDVIGGLLLGWLIVGTTRVSYSRYDRTPIRKDTTIITGSILLITFSLSYIMYQYPSASRLY